jgi:GTPase Era involved in 16S rRNA processing
MATGGVNPNPAGPDQQEQVNATPSTPAKAAEIHLVIAGRPGAGKSILLKKILGWKAELELCTTSSTKKCETKEDTRHGITVRVTDTVGLGDRKQERKKELKKLHQHTRGHADLLVYCLSVNPGSRFDFGNPAIMKSLQSAYGKEIWKHCVLVFTYSKLARGLRG